MDLSRTNESLTAEVCCSKDEGQSASAASKLRGRRIGHTRNKILFVIYIIWAKGTSGWSGAHNGRVYSDHRLLRECTRMRTGYRII